MYEARDRCILEMSGWLSAEDDTRLTPYERLVDRLGFRLQGERLIDPPAGSAGFDLSVPSAGTEFELRRALYELFLENFASEKCLAIDVNHGEWMFQPAELRLTTHFEPFPVSVTPWAEYVAFGSGDFSHGVFCNPSNRHLLVFGDSFVARFSEMLADRLVAAEAAVKHNGPSAAARGPVSLEGPMGT